MVKLEQIVDGRGFFEPSYKRVVSDAMWLRSVSMSHFVGSVRIIEGISNVEHMDIIRMVLDVLSVKNTTSKISTSKKTESAEELPDTWFDHILQSIPFLRKYAKTYRLTFDKNTTIVNNTFYNVIPKDVIGRADGPARWAFIAPDDGGVAAGLPGEWDAMYAVCESIRKYMDIPCSAEIQKHQALIGISISLRELDRLRLENGVVEHEQFTG